MQTIEVSDTVYQEILSRRRGRDSISKTLERELLPEARVQADRDTLDADMRRWGKGRTYTLDQVEKRLGL